VCVGKPQRNNKQMMSAGAYATATDFQQIFTDDVNSLYLLSLLLSGDHEKAEECFVAGIGESTKANHVFKEWAHSWARRTIIQSAIRVIAPRERSATAIRNPFDAAAMDRVPLVLHSEVRAILELAPFERFVFVMSVLERYSDNDCSILLGCPRRDITTTRARAMQQLVRLLALKQKSPADTGSTNSIPSDDAETVIELVIAQHFVTAAWNKSIFQ
jgi:DNA-directed RNA polymerase specialized sigma24 family protein